MSLATRVRHDHVDAAQQVEYLPGECGIITDVSHISGGRVRLRAGTLYTALDRLRTDELIAVDREEIVDNRLRRYYRLTPTGSQKLAAEAARLQANAAAALSRLARPRLDPAGGAA